MDVNQAIAQRLARTGARAAGPRAGQWYGIPHTTGTTTGGSGWQPAAAPSAPAPAPWQPTGQMMPAPPAPPRVATIPPGGGQPTITHGPPALVPPPSPGWGGAMSGGWTPGASSGSELHPALANALQVRAGRGQGGAGAPMSFARMPWSVNRFG